MYLVLAEVSSLLSQSLRQVSHVLLTRSPLSILVQAPKFLVRLACFKRAASVRPEPGSNSPSKISVTNIWNIDVRTFNLECH
jgi:hypothetical protein